MVKAQELTKSGAARKCLESASIGTLAYMHQLKRRPICFAFTKTIFGSRYSSDSILPVSTRFRDFTAGKRAGDAEKGRQRTQNVTLPAVLLLALSGYKEVTRWHFRLESQSDGNQCELAGSKVMVSSEL